MERIGEWWSSWQGELRSVLRIIAAAMFMLAGTSKLFAFPIGMPPNGQTATFGTQIWIGGALEVVGGGLAVLYCFVWLYFSAAGPGPWSVDESRRS